MTTFDAGASLDGEPAVNHSTPTIPLSATVIKRPPSREKVSGECDMRPQPQTYVALRPKKAGDVYAMVIFRDRTPTPGRFPAKSKIQAGKALALVHRDELIDWLKGNGLIKKITSYSDPTALGSFELRAEPEVLRAIEKHELVERVVAE